MTPSAVLIACIDVAFDKKQRGFLSLPRLYILQNHLMFGILILKQNNSKDIHRIHVKVLHK